MTNMYLQVVGCI